MGKEKKKRRRRRLRSRGRKKKRRRESNGDGRNVKRRFVSLEKIPARNAKEKTEEETAVGR